MRVLIADQQENAQPMADLLRRQRYTPELAPTGREALDWALAGGYSCMILSEEPGAMTGPELLVRLRERGSDLPVLLLIDAADARSRVRGFDAGADDCLSRPYFSPELVARVRALTRRGALLSPDLLTAGDLTLDRRTFYLSCNGRSIRLGNREFQLVELLLRRQGQLLSTERLMDEIWGFESGAGTSVVWTNIAYLRRKLKLLGSSARILLRRGQGYLLWLPSEEQAK